MPSSRNITEDIDKAIGQAVRAVRTARGMSQSALAEKLGLTFQQIQKYEKGTNRISVSALVLICRALAVSPMDFIGPHVGEKSDLTSLAKQNDLLKSQLADIKSAIKAASR